MQIDSYLILDELGILAIDKLFSSNVIVQNTVVYAQTYNALEERMHALSAEEQSAILAACVETNINTAFIVFGLVGPKGMTLARHNPDVSSLMRKIMACAKSARQYMNQYTDMRKLIPTIT